MWPGGRGQGEGSGYWRTQVACWAPPRAQSHLPNMEALFSRPSAALFGGDCRTTITDLLQIAGNRHLPTPSHPFGRLPFWKGGGKKGGWGGGRGAGAPIMHSLPCGRASCNKTPVGSKLVPNTLDYSPSRPITSSHYCSKVLPQMRANLNWCLCVCGIRSNLAGIYCIAPPRPPVVAMAARRSRGTQQCQTSRKIDHPGL